ncbi:hypothetical protein [Acidipropionibacterium timonense]|uniref:hypothetical protein n=1 Tax=Acidipropionibacterium timonense TaxID=2161818 RepID=UPI00102FC7B8|nr:hypothetical protein [Acidipropionibacterium timonense]
MSTLTIHADGTGILCIDGHDPISEPGPDANTTRDRLLGAASRQAHDDGVDLVLHVTDGDDAALVVVRPDGSMEAMPDDPTPTPPPAPPASPAPPDLPAAPVSPVTPALPDLPVAPAPSASPAVRGWRAAPVMPAEPADGPQFAPTPVRRGRVPIDVLLDGPAAQAGGSTLFAAPLPSRGPAQVVGSLPDRTIVLANLKGGAGKTPLAIVVAQALAALAGHNDIALVELNPRGTLADRTIRSCTGDVTGLAAAARRDPGFGRSLRDLDPFISWQAEGWATVVCPTSITAGEGGLITPVDGDDVAAIARCLHHSQRVVIYDTGNNDVDAAWQRAITDADRVLVPVQWDPDTMQMAQRMITDMDRIGHGNLKGRVLWVGTHAPSRRPDRGLHRQYRHALEVSGWHVMDLPPDKHLAAETVIEWAKLSRRTRGAATAIARDLIEPTP